MYPPHQRSITMSLPPDSLDPIPAETARVAHAAFPKGSVAICIRDVLGTIYHDGMFADLYPPEGQPALHPWRLALVTVLQYTENLSDVQAATAVRGRIDWKYALALPLEDAGFDASDLSTFRDRLLAGSAEERLLWALVDACSEQRLIKKRGRVRTDATHVLASVRRLHRLELVGETLRAALEALAVAAPDWLREQLSADRASRYLRRIEESRLPEGEEKRAAWANETGRDGALVLAQVAAPTAPAWLRDLPAVGVLTQVWAQQYEGCGDAVRLRAVEALPSATEQITSPYDTEARYGQKRQLGWVFNKAHTTESCDDEGPQLIVQMTTTPACADDHATLPIIWADLAERDLLPDEHLADRGYVDGPRLVTAETYGMTLVGPVQSDSSWQARQNQGYGAADFTVDWEQQVARCPQGCESVLWSATHDDRREAVIRVRFAAEDCAVCPARARCTRATTAGRSLTLPPREQYEARRAVLAQQDTDAFWEQYAIRAGIEGTISQMDRRTGLRQARYRGQAKTHLQHCAQAAAINVIRLVDYVDEHPRALTRRSHLARLFDQAA